jgi:hypothetical protein
MRCICTRDEQGCIYASRCQEVAQAVHPLLRKVISGVQLASMHVPEKADLRQTADAGSCPDALQSSDHGACRRHTSLLRKRLAHVVLYTVLVSGWIGREALITVCY